jgi:hypothetical protein
MECIVNFQGSIPTMWLGNANISATSMEGVKYRKGILEAA